MAQLVAQLFRNEKVGSSSLSSSAKQKLFGVVVPIGLERQLVTLEAVGSNPIDPAKRSILQFSHFYFGRKQRILFFGLVA